MVCLRAEEHYQGKEIKEGIHVELTLRKLRALKQDSQYNFKCALESIISASTWPGERVQLVNPSFDPVCPRCGYHTESAFHCFWDCPANDTIDHEYVKETQNTW